MCFFLFKQKTAYEMRISDWSSDVCSSDLAGAGRRGRRPPQCGVGPPVPVRARRHGRAGPVRPGLAAAVRGAGAATAVRVGGPQDRKRGGSGKSWSVLVTLGGGRIITKK